MATIKGNDLLIYDGTYIIATSKSCEVDIQGEVKEVSSPSSGEYREFIPGRKTWNVLVNYLIDTTSTVKGRMLKVGQTITLSMKVRNNGTIDTLTGQAICTECKITATRGALLQGSFTFQGSGPLE